MSVWKRLLIRQWPFWLGGLLVGIAEILFYARYDMFIVVTTGLAQMFAVPEALFFNWDGVGQAYEPGVHWLIVGALLGARLVAMVEQESRAWVRFQPSMLVMAFIGGALFSFGTRLSAGCTTHHFIGGIAAMSLASWTVLLTGIPFAFLAFLLIMKMNLGGYYRHQDNLESAHQCVNNPDQPFPGFHPEYRPWKNPIHILLTVLLLLIFGIPVYYGLFTNDIASGLSDIGWSHLLWLLLCGLLLGFGIAKCGYGTECAIMAPHASLFGGKRFRDNGVPMVSYTMFRALLPLQGLMTSIVVFNLYILYAWWRGIGPIPNASGEYGLYLGHFLGGPLLAIGAVFMIGCEVRTYARLGLGYGTALAALPGFYVGYLPYTFFRDTIDDAMLTKGLTTFTTLPQTAMHLFGGSEALWNVMYTLLLITILVISFVAGKRYINTSYRTLLTAETDALLLNHDPKQMP
ncbi:MAG: YeeE/YedE family protein [Magnetococcus sp. YQC-5]